MTHAGHCGSCSSLQDLGVYLGRNLTEPTRRCGALSIVSADLMRKCLQRIGFSDNCIPIWEYNILNTRQECTRVIEDIFLEFIKNIFWSIKNIFHKLHSALATILLQVCIISWILGEDNNKPDGSLNDCLQCDEDMSGPNFKFFSGRTRRNSGIPSAIARPPDEFYDMEHCYWYGDL